jgi:hypothetical protein
MKNKRFNKKQSKEVRVIKKQKIKAREIEQLFFFVYCLVHHKQ